jgi:predicted transcriptional regulator
MSHSLTVQLSDAAYAALQQYAQTAAQSPAELAAAALEQRFSGSDGVRASNGLMCETERQAARQRFERHFGAVNLGYATGADNEGIDADLARAYADPHEGG